MPTEWSMLKVLAVVVGILAVWTRGVAVFAPEFVRKMLKVLLEHKGVLLWMMVTAAILGGLFIWGFRLAYPAEASWQAYVLLVFGVIVTVVALLMLAAPKVCIGLVTWMSAAPATTLRLLALVGVVVGLAILLLGVSM